MNNKNDKKLDLNKSIIANLETSPPFEEENTSEKDVVKQPDTALIKPDLKPAEPNPENKP